MLGGGLRQACKGIAESIESRNRHHEIVHRKPLSI
jgi:hypothetical protein